MLLTILNSLGIHHLCRIFNKQNITILCLHQISCEKNSFFPPLTPDNFYKLIKYIKKHYNIIHFNDISNEKLSSKPNLILSFDDGYYDFIENALPILNKYKIKSNHNIVNQCVNINEVIWTQKMNLYFENFKKEKSLHTTILFLEENLNVKIQNCFHWYNLYQKVFILLLKIRKEKREILIDSWKYFTIIDTNSIRMMDWNDLKICMDEQVEIGSHTYTHDVLNTIENQNELDFEIKKSINEINERLKINCNIISLPNGQFNQSVLNYINKLELQYILTVNDGIKHKKNIFDRIYMINENPKNMLTRVELIPQTLRKWKNTILLK